MLAALSQGEKPREGERKQEDCSSFQVRGHWLAAAGDRISWLDRVIFVLIRVQDPGDSEYQLSNQPMPRAQL